MKGESCRALVPRPTRVRMESINRQIRLSSILIFRVPASKPTPRAVRGPPRDVNERIVRPCFLFASSTGQAKSFLHREPLTVPRPRSQEGYEYRSRGRGTPIESELEQFAGPRPTFADATEVAISSVGNCFTRRPGVPNDLDAGSNKRSWRSDSDAPTSLDFLPREAKNQNRRVHDVGEKFIGNRVNEDVYVAPDTLAKLADQMDRVKRHLPVPGNYEAACVSITCRPFPRRRASYHGGVDVKFNEAGKSTFERNSTRPQSPPSNEKTEAVIQVARAPLPPTPVILDYFGDPNASSIRHSG